MNRAEVSSLSAKFTAVNFLPAWPESEQLAIQPKAVCLPYPSLRQVTIAKQVREKTFPVVHWESQPHRRLRRRRGQVSGGGELAERIACGALGSLEHDLGIAPIQSTMPKNGRNQFGCPFVIDGIRNKKTIALVQSAEVEQLC